MTGVAVFVYVKFDSYWPTLRATLNPVNAWNRVFGGGSAEATPASRATFSADSTRLALECPGGLAGCCEGDAPSLQALCSEAGALLAKARARGLIGPDSGQAMRLEARAFSDAEGRRGHALSLARGRDPRGAFSLQRGETGTWCEARRGCLANPAPRAPLAGGRLARGSAPNVGRWIGASASVRPSLAGRVVAIDSVAGGARVHVYHGGELYTAYEPLQPAPGLALDAAVSPGTVLGTAPAAAGGYAVNLRIRRAGLNVDPFDFFALRAPAEASESDSADSSAADTTSGE